MQGGDVTVTGGGNAIKVNDAGVVCGGVRTANATVYLIDTVLMPPRINFRHSQYEAARPLRSGCLRLLLAGIGPRLCGLTRRPPRTKRTWTLLLAQNDYQAVRNAGPN